MVLLLFIVVPVVCGCLVLGICFVLQYFMPSLREERVVVDFLFIVTPIVGGCDCSMLCCMLLYVHSSIAIILMGKSELVALLNLSSWRLVMVEWPILAVPWGCLLFAIVVFPDHTHLHFWALYFCCVLNVMLLLSFFGPFSRCRGLVCSM